ncbi:hypothetical protein NST21_13595 [Peribacillus sp. FSL K6-1552]|uniref:hypothetical protein n=1 Tax=Peribacillus sp. FSL K6-1552 TaxID=2954514 RepID=UPI0030FC8B84
MSYFAVCPACNNPIRIISLYVDKSLDENGNKMPLHARHYKKDVKNLVRYEQERYDSCPLSNFHSFSQSEKRENKERRNEIIALIKTYPEILYNYIRIITKIKFSDAKFDEMLDNFMKSEGYYYVYLNKFNLPYSFLNMQKSVNIYFQTIDNDKYSKDMINSINQSKYFTVNRYNRIEKKVKEYATIELYLANHKKYSDDKEVIELNIIEKSYKDKVESIIYKRSIEVNKTKFINIINKYKRLREIADKHIKYLR